MVFGCAVQFLRSFAPVLEKHTRGISRRGTTPGAMNEVKPWSAGAAKWPAGRAAGPNAYLENGMAEFAIPIVASCRPAAASAD